MIKIKQLFAKYDALIAAAQKQKELHGDLLKSQS
jgi:hypothetical protein